MMRALLPIVLAIALLISSGCTSAIRYSLDSKAEMRTVPREPVGDTTWRVDDPIDREVRHEPRETSKENDENRDPTGIGSDGAIDKSLMNRIVSRYLGTPYEKGGSGKLGLDCSGLAYVVYRDYDGTRLPLSVQSLYRLDDRVGYDELTYGDLLFFRIDDRRVSHVGIYLENGRFVHSSESRGVVIDDIADEYFATRYAGARRVK
jgi:cell wall-associated NlpC family hydrolase